MVDTTEYTFLAHRFNKEMGVDVEGVGYDDDVVAQQRVVKEEFREYKDAFKDGDRAEVAEEMADVLITLFVQAERMGIDIGAAYRHKMTYNLGKTGDRNDEGKVVDDSELYKPDFEEFTDGFEC